MVTNPLCEDYLCDLASEHSFRVVEPMEYANCRHEIDTKCSSNFRVLSVVVQVLVVPLSKATVLDKVLVKCVSKVDDHLVISSDDIIQCLGV